MALCGPAMVGCVLLIETWVSQRGPCYTKHKWRNKFFAKSPVIKDIHYERVYACVITDNSQRTIQLPTEMRRI